MRDHEHGEAAELVAGHGSAKQTESTDPLELRGTAVPGGDPGFLARCLIEEFAGMGHGPDEILELFRRPEYLALHAYWRDVGDEAVSELIDDVIARCGVIRVTEVHAEPETGSCPHQRGADGAAAGGSAAAPDPVAAPGVDASGDRPRAGSVGSSPLHQIRLPGEEGR